ncbi:MAG: transporter substrate-binding domain-containing protein [Bacillota bacterium]|nr:transporter substrate-binding domain-containing protein [Bacillota bacterium]
MKKLLALALALVMLSGLTALAADGGVLTVALSPDFAPMEFIDISKTGDDQYVGFDVTLAKFIAAELGMTLKIKPMSFDACQTAVQVGAVDMSISGYSWTEERAKNFNLSDYYYAGDNETEQVVIVKAEEAGKYSKPEDFAGKVVAAQAASLQYDLVTKQLPQSELKEFKVIDDAVMALMSGKVDAVAVAMGNGESIIANNPAIGMSGFSFEVDEKAENNVVMIQKGNDELLAKVNAALAKAYEQKLYGGWYEEAKALAGIDTAKQVSYTEDGQVAEDQPQ